MKLKNWIFEVWIFILSRSIVYLLSFISYRGFLFKPCKIYQIFRNGFIENYLKKYYLDIATFVFLIVMYIIFLFFTKNRIKNSVTKQEKIISIKKIGIESQLEYLTSFLLPLIAGFQKVNFIWIVVYEAFIFIIVLKNINGYYRKIYSMFYKEYIVTLENDIEIFVFSKKKENEIKKQIGKDTLLNSVNIHDEILGDKIFFY